VSNSRACPSKARDKHSSLFCLIIGDKEKRKQMALLESYAFFIRHSEQTSLLLVPWQAFTA